MEPRRPVLAGPHLSVISAEPDHDLDAIARTITGSVRIDGCAALARLLGRLADRRDARPRTLDLLGHSTPHTGHLRLGGWVIDAADPAVAAWFRALADREVLPRLGITAVRLLGCRTADTDPARATICRLAEILGVEVWGARHLLYGAHYDAHGYRDAWRFLLVGSTELRAIAAPAVAPAEPWPRTLDLDALPAGPLDAGAGSWRLTAAAARELVGLIRRHAGAPMPGRPAPASWVLALPAAAPGMFHVAHVLLDGAFVRFYPDGMAAPGVVYPVDDAPALRRIMDAPPVG